MEGFSETRPFIHLSKHVFHSQLFQKYLSYEAFFFFSKCSKFNVQSKTAIEIEKKFFRLVFEIIVFELVALNSPYYYENTRRRSSMC